MKTDDLIDLLSQDAKQEPLRQRSLLAPTALAVVPSLLVVLLVMGPRVDWPDLQARASLAIKILLATGVLILALKHLKQATRPEVSLRGRITGFAVPLVLALALVAGSLALRSPGQWSEAIFGETLGMCLTAIPLLAIPMLTMALWVLRQGAVSDGFRGGLLAGLLAGGASVLVYTLHCTEDDPAFFGIWYTLGVVIVMLLGGLIGRWVLRW